MSKTRKLYNLSIVKLHLLVDERPGRDPDPDAAPIRMLAATGSARGRIPNYFKRE
jgi:hypothetical protein